MMNDSFAYTDAAVRHDRFKHCVCLGIACGLLPALALDYYGKDDWCDVNADKGAAVTIDGGMFGAGSGLSKSGEGDLTGDISNWYTPSQLTAYLFSGGFVARAASVGPEAIEKPNAILNNAVLWLDASANKFTFVGEGGSDVSYWYDVRETNEGGVWSSDYWAAEARNTNNTTAASATMTYPSLDTAKAALPLMYFHGFGSGSWMKLVAPGKHDGTQNNYGIEGIRHIFVAYQFDNAFGFMLGSAFLSYTTCRPAFFHPGETSKRPTQLFTDQNSRTELVGGTLYVNGSRANITATAPTGLTVLNWNSGCVYAEAKNQADLSAFFNDRNLFSSRRQGGDWIGEVIAFTNNLTAAERAQVEAYLLNKWRGSVNRGDVNLVVGDQAKLCLEAPTGATYSGAGEVDVVGTYVTTVNVSRAGSRFDGTIRVTDAATMGVQGAEPTFSLAGGDVLSMANDIHDVRMVTRTSGADDAIVIAATNTLRVGTVPAGVSRMAVSGAREVVLASPRAAKVSLASTNSLEVTVPNAGFESSFSSANWMTGSSGGDASSSRLKLNTSSWWFDGGLANFTHKTFEGSYCLGLKKNAWAVNTVTLPDSGRYEFSCLVSSRSVDFSSGVMDVQLIKDNVTNFVGRIYGDYPKVPLRERLLSPALAAGKYKLRLVLDKTTNKGGDVHIFVDSVRMRRIPDTSRETVFAVPNGGFEVITNYPNTADRSTERSAYVSVVNRIMRPKGWTLTGCANTLAGVTAKQFMCGAFTRGMAGYVNYAAMTHGSVQLMLCGTEPRAETDSFTPPAGTWRVRLRSGRLRGDSNSTSPAFNQVDSSGIAKVKVEVAVGEGDWTDLGTLSASIGFDTVTYGTTFTVDGTLRVRLALSQTVKNYVNSTARALVDDVELVKVECEGTELVTNGSFESGATGWTFVQNKDLGGNNSAAAAVDIGSGSVFYGYEKCDGSRHLRIGQMGAVHQSVSFPEAGTYRLSFWTRARPDNLDGSFGGTHMYSGNSVRAYLKDGESRETQILLTDPVYSWCYVEHSALFTVPTAGTYELWLQGTVDGTKKPIAGGDASRTDSHAFVDLISVKREVPTMDVPEIGDDLTLDCGGAALRLDYPGLIKLKELRFGGCRRSGLIDGSHASGLVTGPGSVYVEPKGFMLIIR